ncbi:hypothetical protein CDL15_Pgr020312 [Punica granatum]|uniref:Uncharacterized protein n=1 Tax=Punica granatum TaxID=22663 RepID=A0A218Y523_PUNGR|nr:hypothetical protein CDL15_Pgr020312 [Punica granatum]
MLHKFAEPARSCFLPPCRVCSLVLLANLAGLLTRASLLSFFASSPSLQDHASSDHAGSAPRASLLSCFTSSPSLLALMLRKFAESAHSCFLRTWRVCSPVRVYFLSSPVRRACRIILLPTMPGLLPVLVYFHASQVRRACSLVLLATLSGLLTRASCELGGSAHPCEFTFILRQFAEPAGSCFFRPCRGRTCWLVPLATLLSLLTRASLLSWFAS